MNKEELYREILHLTPYNGGNKEDYRKTLKEALNKYKHLVDGLDEDDKPASWDNLKNTVTKIISKINEIALNSYKGLPSKAGSKLSNMLRVNQNSILYKTLPINSAFYRMLSKYYPWGFIEEPLMKVRIRGNNTGRKAMVRLRMSYQLNERRKENSDGFDVKDLFVRTMIRYNAWGYKMLSSLSFNDGLKERIAKVYWLPAFIFERLYSRRYQKKSKAEEIYILRYDSSLK